MFPNPPRVNLEPVNYLLTRNGTSPHIIQSLQYVLKPNPQLHQMRLDLPLLQQPLHEPTERDRKIVVLRVRREILTLEPERLTKRRIR